jgi:hypothetical protein
LKILTRGFSALCASYKPGTIKGSALQLGGAVIVNPDETVAYYYASAEAFEKSRIFQENSLKWSNFNYVSEMPCVNT